MINNTPPTQEELRTLIRLLSEDAMYEYLFNMYKETRANLIKTKGSVNDISLMKYFSEICDLNPNEVVVLKTILHHDKITQN